MKDNLTFLIALGFSSGNNNVDSRLHQDFQRIQNLQKFQVLITVDSCGRYWYWDSEERKSIQVSSSWIKTVDQVSKDVSFKLKKSNLPVSYMN